jgi:hypothetical protein
MRVVPYVRCTPVATNRGLVVEIEMSYKLQKKKVRKWKELIRSNLRSWNIDVNRSPR